MVLEFKDVAKAYRDQSGTIEVLSGVSFTLAAGETLALTGESGSGKSTVLHIAAGLEDVDAGSVLVAGQNIAKMPERKRAAMRRSEVALIFQQFNLIPSLTVAANIAFQASLAGPVDKPFVEELAENLGLTSQMHKYPEALSGGQQQRVAIARSLAAKPKLLLADEPTGNLDEATANDVLEQLLALVAQTGASLMVVTHSPKLAERMERNLHLHGGRLT